MEMIQIPKTEYEALRRENEDLKKENEALKSEIEILKGLIIVLTNEITELKAKINKNSNNSNKPPSSDGPKKQVIKNSRTPSGKKTGGQQGHEGKTKDLTSSPDKVIELKPTEGCECGGQVVVKSETYTSRQVSDIIKPQLITVEYRAKSGACAECGKEYKASFPKGVDGVVSYGENLQAIVTYLNIYQLLPIKRTTELIKDLFGIDISQATVISSGEAAYENVEPTEGRIKEEVIESEVAGFDESGMRVAGKNFWLHTASTDICTVYSIHPKRGKEAMDAIGILPKFRGTAIHDHWKSYYHYECAHGECNQHHLRHLKYLYEELGCEWAFEMTCFLLRVKRHVDLTKLFLAGTEVNSLEQEDIEIYERIYRGILENAQKTIEESPLDSQRMVKRLLKYEQETLLFMYDFAVPFTNNGTERDIRMPKAKQKISGGFRTKKGADVFARVRGYISTVKKRGKNVLEGLKAVFNKESLDFLSPTC